MKLFEDLMMLVKSTAAKVSLPTSRYDVLTVNINEHLDPNPYFGHRFETALRDACLPRDDEELRLRCRHFIVELFNHLRQRLPENIQCLQKTSLLSVEHALKLIQEPANYGIGIAVPPCGSRVRLRNAVEELAARKMVLYKQNR
ncbi:hypothetical protein HPB50_029234 [Hyalomma asiaticum]|nr:hypothetical protein HPB50_029234 [Hyalomma asiaticum]